MIKGSKHSAEAKQKMGIARKKYFSDPINKKKTNEAHKKYYETHDGPNKGKPMLEKAKQKLRDRKVSVETKRKLSRSGKKYFETHDNPRKGKHHTAKSKRKLSESMKKFFETHEAPNKGGKRTAESRKNMSKAQKKYFKTHDAYNKGVPMTEEQKHKLRVPCTAEAKRKLSIAMKGKKHSEETKQRLSELHKHKWLDISYREKKFATNPFFNHHREHPTSIELFTQAKMIHLGIYDYVPEFRIPNTKGGYYFADFLIFPNLIIECDGIHWHNLEGAPERDAIRQRDIESQGWQVIRFTETEIHANLQGVGDKIIEIYNQQLVGAN